MADWRWPWETAPAAMGEPAPVVVPASVNQTPTQNAQAVIDRYWQWANSGAQTTALDKAGNPVADNDAGAQKDPKTSTVLKYPVDPISGAVDQNFPTIADITAARATIEAKSPDDAATKLQAKAVLDKTLKGTELIQAQIDAAKAKPTAHPNVTPGEGVWNPTLNGGAGGYEVAVPTKADKPSAPPLSQGQVDTQATDTHNQAVASANRDNVAAANTESPAQAYARQVAAANATAHAQGQAKIDEARALVDAGITMTEEQKARLAADLQSIQSDHDATIKQVQTQYDYDLAQPNKQKDQAVAQQQADAVTANAANNATQTENTRVNNAQQAQQASVNEQVTALTAQATQGQANMDRVVKAGSAVPMSMATFRMSADPLQLAFQLAHQAVATGALPPSALPTRNGAPLPVAAAPGPPTAPLPAPGVLPPVPAPTPPPLLPPGVAGTAGDPRYGGTMPPQQGPY